MLTPDERALFRRLGVFVGGAALESVELVAVAAGPLRAGVLDGLDGLVRHGLVQHAERDGEPRFRMLETVREFALERLALAGEAAATRAAQAGALLRRLDGDLRPEEWGPGWGWSALGLPALERERENLRLALGWCAERQDPERGLRLATRATRLWQQGGPRTEGLAWLRRFLRPAGRELPAWLRARALWSACLLAELLGDHAAAGAFQAEGRALAEASGDEQALLRFLFLLVANLVLTDDRGEAVRPDALAAAQAAGEQELAIARRLGVVTLEAAALMHLGTLAHLRGDLAEAAARYAAALALADAPQRWWPLRNLGYLALAAGRLPEADERFHAALRETWGPQLESGALEDLNALAALVRERGRWERAARLLGAVDAGLERLGGALPEPIGRRERERTLAAARERLGAPAFAAAYAAGRALSLAQAVAEDDGG